MELGIRLHLTDHSFTNIVRELDIFGVNRSRKAVHDCHLQPTDGVAPNHVALDEPVIRLNDQQYWLYAAVNPKTNELLHIRLFLETTTALTEIFLAEFAEKHDLSDTCFSSMEQAICRPHSSVERSDFNTKNEEIEMLSNVFLMR